MMFFRIFHGNWRGPGQKEEKTVFVRVGVDFRHYLHQFKGAKLHVFMCIMLHMNEDGVSFPSYDVLMEETGYNRGSVSKALAALCDEKIGGFPVLMRWRDRDDKGHYTGANQYKIFPTKEEIQSMENQIVDIQSTENPTVDKSNGGKSGLKEEPSLEEEIVPETEDQLNSEEEPEQQQDVVVGSSFDEFQTIKDLIPAATDAAVEAWLRLHGYARLRERVDWYLLGLEKAEGPSRPRGIGWLAKCLDQNYSLPDWMKERPSDKPPADYHDYEKGLRALGWTPAPPLPPPPPTIMVFDKPLLAARVPGRPAIRQTPAPRLTLVPEPPPNGNGHQPERTAEEKRQAALAYLEANPPKLNATPRAPRKPGEPDRHLGTPAPQPAGHNRPRPKEMMA